VYDFFLDRPQFALMKLYNIRVPLNRAKQTFKLIREILT